MSAEAEMGIRAKPIPKDGRGLWFDAVVTPLLANQQPTGLRKGTMLYTQGEAANSVYFLVRGKVRLSVLSKAGKEAVLGVIGPGDFCGEGCLAGQTRRMGSATAMTPAAAYCVEKELLVRELHREHPLAEAFLARLLARNISFEEDICDQLFNHSEKRLARALLKLARFGQEPSTDGYRITPKISQETLAEMIGTTRSRVNFFMNKFRRLGLIDYNGEVHVHAELLTDVVLGD
jgi:CRP/FNR family cyclic AMP-dependent transcriptional regulator